MNIVRLLRFGFAARRLHAGTTAPGCSYSHRLNFFLPPRVQAQFHAETGTGPQPLLMSALEPGGRNSDWWAAVQGWMVTGKAAASSVAFVGLVHTGVIGDDCRGRRPFRGQRWKSTGHAWRISLAVWIWCRASCRLEALLLTPRNDAILRDIPSSAWNFSCSGSPPLSETRYRAFPRSIVLFTRKSSRVPRVSRTHFLSDRKANAGRPRRLDEPGGRHCPRSRPAQAAGGLRRMISGSSLDGLDVLKESGSS